MREVLRVPDRRRAMREVAFHAQPLDLSDPIHMGSVPLIYRAEKIDEGWSVRGYAPWELKA